MRKIFIIIALIASMAACQQQTGRTSSNGNEDSTAKAIDSMWIDSIKRLYKATLYDHYLNNEKDSFMEKLPAIMQLCQEHRAWRTYYQAWNNKIDLILWEGDLQTATQEANAMYDDANAKHDSSGISTACSAMGHIYLYQDNYPEAIKSYAKAVDYYPRNPNQADAGQLILDYFYYCQATELAGNHAATDSILKDWGKLIERFPVRKDDPQVDVKANWRVQYLYNRFTFLLEESRIAEAEPLLDSLYYYEEMEGNVPRNVALIDKAYVKFQIRKKDWAKANAKNIHYRREMEKLGDHTGMVIASFDRATIMKGMGRYREAYEALETARTMNDSITQADNREQLNELNKRFEVNELKMQQERERMQAKEDVMKAREYQGLLIGTIIALVLIAIIIVVVIRLRSARRLAAISAQKERIESELKIARDIQMSMVPSKFPEREGLDMYASMTPAKEVGGDLYGYVLQGDKLYFALGDVSGKGVPASLFMAQTTRLFRTLAAQGMMPADICNRMNDELTDGNESAMFVTLFIGLLDLTTGHLDFCNAGHNPPVIGGDADKGRFLEMLPNAPIGLWPGLQYEGEEIDNIKGRPLFVYTDGLNEAENQQKEQFGDDRLISILRNTHFDTARQVIETLETAVEAHRNGAEPNDDLTMMCLRVGE